MNSRGRPLYSIGAAARMVGVPTATLRTWEERYGLIRPERTAGGQRVYSRDDIEQLRFVKERLEEGASPADAHRLLRERLSEPEGGGLRMADPEARRLFILLAERDPFAAELNEYFLRTEGYAVEVAFGVDEAARAFETTTPDLCIVELLISGGAGTSLVARLRDSGAGPILAISDLDAGDQALDAGADAFLRKPLDPLQLVSTVKDLLGESAILRTHSKVTA